MTVQATYVVPWLLWSAQYKTFFPHRTLFQFMCLHRPVTCAGSRAGPPVSECVSTVGSFDGIGTSNRQFVLYVLPAGYVFRGLGTSFLIEPWDDLLGNPRLPKY